jgi:uncharacterized Zn-binding protein involved in type VI secretion
MPGVVRIGDPNIAGGLTVFPGARSVLVNGRPVATTGTLVTPHPPCPKPATHCSAVTTIGSMTVLAEGKPINYVGSPDSCFHTRALGSTDVQVGR